VSRAGFKCCAGAIDGVLIWLHKLSQKDCIDNGCDKGKFYCGRKKRYGLNCQAVCNVKGQILDISILYPGSTSDCLAFESMSLFQKLEDMVDDLGGTNGRYNRQRRYNYVSETTRLPLPRNKLHSYIASIGVTRPAPLSR
jgi:hypothetical protein